MPDYLKDIEEVFWENARGKVFKGKFRNKPIAIKTSSSSLVDYPWFRSNYEKILNSPNENILKFWETANEKAAKVTVIMEFAECGSLYNQIHKSEAHSYTSRDALNWMQQCAKGVAYLHSLGIYHGNLKSVNLFLFDDRRRLKVGELAMGIEESCNDYAPPEARKKFPENIFQQQLNTIVGQSIHLPVAFYTEKYDIYSFGIVLWEVLSHKRPVYYYVLKERRLCCQTDDINSLIANCCDKDTSIRPNMETVIGQIDLIERQNSSINGLIPNPTIVNIADVSLENSAWIGKGTYGDVYKIQHNNVQLAVKMCKPSEKNEYKNLERELLELSRADHENIIKFFGSKQNVDGAILMVMEYADCGSLENFLYPKGKANYEYKNWMAFDWMLQVAKGLAYLHAMKPNPVIHRDVKPHNVMLAHGYRIVKIVDFGLAREQPNSKTGETAESTHQDTTSMTSCVGTGPYMAPEISAPTAHISYTIKTDVYSFAIMLWQLISRKKPYYHLRRDLNITYLIRHVRDGTRPFIDALNIFCKSQKLKTLIKKCWSANPDERLDMNEIIRVLERIY